MCIRSNTKQTINLLCGVCVCVCVCVCMYVREAKNYVTPQTTAIDRYYCMNILLV